MLSLLLLACTPTPSTDSTDSAAPADTGDTAADTGDSGDTGADTGADTADTGDTADTADSAEDTGPSYLRDVFPVYQSTCGDCHANWGGVDDPDAVYASLLEGEMGKPYVTPGDRDASWLYDKIAHDAPADRKQRMPPSTPLLDEATLGALAAWIDAGAADDADWQGLFNNVWMQRHCHNCHDEWGQDPDTVRTNLLAGEANGVPLVDPGDHTNSYIYLKTAWDPPPDYGDQMPLTFAYLDAETIERIGVWIDAGAPRD